MRSPYLFGFNRCVNLFIILISSLLLVQRINAQQKFWVPANPPKCHYTIDAHIDLERNVIEGRETVSLKNDYNGSISVVALDWSISVDSSIDITAAGKSLRLLNSEKESQISSPLFFQLSSPVDPGSKVEFDIAFKKKFKFSNKHTEFKIVHWYPRLWWDGLPVHDSFSVKLNIPEGFALAISGRLNGTTGRYEIEGAKTFGIYLGKNQKTEFREVEGILVTTLFTEKGAKCAAVCMDTAVDAIKFYKEWLGFYPFRFLYIIPGGKGRWGGYPFATGIVVIHGQETFKEGESLLHWQRITAHEIGHEYWGEWVLDPDRPKWLWIGMGIFADAEYLIARKINPEQRASWMGNYVRAVPMYYDTTVDIPPDRLAKIKYDYNNIVVHSKCFGIISALDVVLGREAFEKIYKKCLRVYGGKRLSWREFQSFCEKETGQSLGWFFDQWVRSNKYLCYQIESEESRREGNEYMSIIRVKWLGSMKMPVPVKAFFEDGTEQVKLANRNLEVSVLTFRSRAKLKKAVLDPEKKLAMLENPLSEISNKAAEVISVGWDTKDSREVYQKIKDEDIPSTGIWYSLGMDLYEGEHFPEAFHCFKKVSELGTSVFAGFASLSCMGILKDLQGEREEALAYYKEALKYDTEVSFRLPRLRTRIDRQWIEERLKTPFKLKKK